MSIKILLVAVLLLSIIIPFGSFLLGEKKKGNFKISLFTNLFFFVGTLVIANILLFSGKVSAAEAEVAKSGLQYLAASISTGLACVGGGIAVSAAASAALGAISEDASVMGKALIFVGMAEGIPLYGLIISFMILG